MKKIGQDSSGNPGLLTRHIGYSQEKRPLLLSQTRAFYAAPGGTLFIGGIHGDERATVLLLLSFLDRLRRSERVLHASLALGVIALANPDGFLRNSRYNARGVDLNRNFEAGWSATSEEPPGPAPWSEPETRALRDFLIYQRPQRIVTLHWALGELDADGPQSNALAETMWNALSASEQAPYRLRLCDAIPRNSNDAKGDCCPGSLGQWCGLGAPYPDGGAPAIVTLELPYDPRIPRPDVLPAEHLETLRIAWKHDARGYLAAVEPSVHKMLEAALC